MVSIFPNLSFIKEVTWAPSGLEKTGGIVFNGRPVTKSVVSVIHDDELGHAEGVS